MKEGDHGPLELGTTTGIDGSWRESLPDDRLADVGCDEQGNATAETVTLLEEFVQEDDYETGDDQLDNQEHTDASTEVRWLSIETSEHVDERLTKGENDREELLSGLVKFAVGFKVEVHVDQVCASQELREGQ